MYVREKWGEGFSLLSVMYAATSHKTRPPRAMCYSRDVIYERSMRRSLVSRERAPVSAPHTRRRGNARNAPAAAVCTKADPLLATPSLPLPPLVHEHPSLQAQRPPRAPASPSRQTPHRKQRPPSPSALEPSPEAERRTTRRGATSTRRSVSTSRASRSSSPSSSSSSSCLAPAAAHAAARPHCSTLPSEQRSREWAQPAAAWMARVGGETASTRRGERTEERPPCPSWPCRPQPHA
mmetsp:Transcript_32591/g.106411  ORF Transcript_32591/g.106411 Transcript_32591/m.106411 type:complete len:237 (+) Transcript_32591:29-739(+)